ncbi:MAG TPA: type II toxin-antitoxin system RatA family toxin [Burkholderiales bacterium]|nr:type II toxin-antitoxin system RatA family toxin [Burkholderiales bacterium]
MKRIARSAIVEHSAEHMYALVEGIEAYPQFLPWCREARVAERGPARTVATLTVGVGGVRYAFTTENANHPPDGIELRLREGPFRHFSARWRFDALGPRATRVGFEMEYAFSGALVSRALGPIFERIADTMVDAFSRRADAVDGPAAR